MLEEYAVLQDYQKVMDYLDKYSIDKLPKIVIINPVEIEPENIDLPF